MCGLKWSNDRPTVCSSAYSGKQDKNLKINSAFLALCEGNPTVDSTQKAIVMGRALPCRDVMMLITKRYGNSQPLFGPKRFINWLRNNGFEHKKEHTCIMYFFILVPQTAENMTRSCLSWSVKWSMVAWRHQVLSGRILLQVTQCDLMTPYGDMTA